VEKILAIELLAAVHALHHRRRKSSSFQMPPHLQLMFEECSAISPPMVKDRYLKSDFEGLLSYMKEQLSTWTELVRPEEANRRSPRIN
jgi:histidine ammonia-lyase